MLSFKPTFSLCSFTVIKRLCSSSSLSAIRVVSSAYLRLLIFLLAILIPACASSSPVFLLMYSADKLNKQVERVYEDLQDLLELTLEKGVFFIIGDWNAKVGSQETPGVTGKFGLGVQNEAGQRLIEFCQENTLVIANTLFQQHKRRLYPWTSTDGQYRNQIDYILCSQRWRNSIQSAETRLGADCGSHHELLIAKFRLKLKKVGKTTR